MANPGLQRDSEATSNSVAALGLRRAALRGMLGSPLIEAEDQRELRQELVTELTTVGRTMARIASRNVSELVAKIDTLGEEYRPGADAEVVQPLLDSIRRDVLTLVPRPAQERSTVQTIRTLHGSRPADQATGAGTPEAGAGE